MNIRIFNRTYKRRRFGEQKVVKGYFTGGYTDDEISIHLHYGTDSVQANAEGARRVVKLEGHGEVKLRTADQKEGTKGDLVFFDDRWFECVSCTKYDHTILSHYNYSFVLVPDDAAGTTDTETPEDYYTVEPEPDQNDRDNDAELDEIDKVFDIEDAPQDTEDTFDEDASPVSDDVIPVDDDFPFSEATEDDVDAILGSVLYGRKVDNI